MGDPCIPGSLGCEPPVKNLNDGTHPRILTPLSGAIGTKPPPPTKLPHTSYGKQIRDDISSRIARPAFKKDGKGNIVSTLDRYMPYHHDQLALEGGQHFMVGSYTLELKNGKKIDAKKSLGSIDLSTQQSKVVSDDHRMDTNCHGVTFTNGEYWINNDQVQTILDCGYELIKPGDIKGGDILVYRDKKNNNIVHSMTVTKVNNHKAIEVSGLGGINLIEETKTPDTGWDEPAKQEYYRAKTPLNQSK
jgi:hypothetical protein